MVSGRGELMGLFFMLASLVFFLRNSGLSLLGSLLCYVLALLSKESAIITPLLAGLALYLKKEPLSRYRPLGLMGVLAILYLSVRFSALGTMGLNLTALHPIRFLISVFP